VFHLKSQISNFTFSFSSVAFPSRPSCTAGLPPGALLFGLVAAFGVTRVIGTLLVGVFPTDPLTFFSVTLILTLAGVLGCMIPARRAIRVDPVVALRHN